MKVAKHAAPRRLPRHWQYFLVTTASIYTAALWICDEAWRYMSLHVVPLSWLVDVASWVVEVAWLMAVAGWCLGAIRSFRFFSRSPVKRPARHRAGRFLQTSLRWLIGAGAYMATLSTFQWISTRGTWSNEMSLVLAMQYPLYETWSYLVRLSARWRYGMSYASSPMAFLATKTKRPRALLVKVWDYLFADLRTDA
jgi:hypothetical protein